MAEAKTAGQVFADGRWRVFAQDPMPPILQAALGAIVDVGYHGTTIRKIAERAGLSVPGVYHHYASKHALLVGIMEFGMDDLWSRTQAAVQEAHGEVGEEFARYVECMVLFHASRPGLAATALSEIRSLEHAARQRHIGRRDRQHAMLEEIISRGCAAKIFSTAHPREATTAIITMCTGIAQWFRPDGDLTPAQLVTRYQDFARNMIGGSMVR